MLKKKIFHSIMGFMSIFLIATNSLAAPINIEISCSMKPGGSEEAGILKFKQLVEKRSEGRMQVTVFMSGQLGNQKSVMQLMRMGQTQMALDGGGFRLAFGKEYIATFIPFLFTSWDSLKAFMEGPVGIKTSQISAEKAGLAYFGIQKQSARNLTANKKIDGPEDIAGLKLRVAPVPIWVNVWKQLGAIPTVVPGAETYLALKTGQVNSQENSLASPYHRKLYEVQEYAIMTEHMYLPWNWIASKVWFDKLSASDQQLIRDAVEEARIFGTSKETELNEYYISELKKLGMKFVEPDHKAIRDKAWPAVDRILKKLDPEVQQEVQRIVGVK